MRYAIRINYYCNRISVKQFYHGQIQYYNAFLVQLERFTRTLEHRASQQDIKCVCAENIITKAKLYNFSEN